MKREILRQTLAQGEFHVKIKAEIGVIGNKPRIVCRPPEAGESHGTESPARPQREPAPSIP